MKVQRAGITINNLGAKPDLGVTCEMWGFYQDGKSLAEVGKMFGIRRQGVFDRFKRRGLPMRSDLQPKNRALPPIDWNGAKYAATKGNYFRKTSGNRSLLHWDIWEQAHGPIPRRHEIRFIDGDNMNTELSNLMCVPRDAGRQYLRTFPPLKPCIYCGQTMMPKQDRKNPEGPAAYNRRQTCDIVCAKSWTRGKPKGTRMPVTAEVRA
jgi:hypothetical protein